MIGTNRWCLVIFLLMVATAEAQAPRRSTSWAMLPFVKVDAVNPVLGPGNASFDDPVSKKKIYWEERDVYNPATVVREGKLFLLYRAQDRVGTSRIGLAESTDGVHFKRYPMPVLYPDHDAQKKYEWPGGCEDPRVVEDEKGTYYMTYTAFDGKLARLMVATSRDLVHWVKRGPVFARADLAAPGRGAAGAGKGVGRPGREAVNWVDKWSKSGSIVSRYVGGRVVAARIKGKYWMYWGDTHIWAAVSDNLIDWTPVEKPVLSPRAKKFDSDLVESGPPAMLTEQGIVLIYNGRNVRSKGDLALPEGTYAGAQALFDKNDPTRLVDRMENYFIKPDKPYEFSGQVNQVCFLEGLAFLRGQWFLYYGTADSKIAVAVHK
ncbi:MAG: glycosidase [Bacteroidetes bacterium]|nr:glycosidase [Bacteroidota bacterium]